MRIFIIGMVVAINIAAAIVGLKGMPAGFAAQPGGETFNKSRMLASTAKTKVFEKLGAIISSKPSVRGNANSEKRTTTEGFMSATEDRLKRDRGERLEGAKFIKN